MNKKKQLRIPPKIDNCTKYIQIQEKIGIWFKINEE